VHEFEAWENAVVTALSPLKAQGLKTLEAYAGQLDVERMEDMVIQFPCIYVLAGPLTLADRARYMDYRLQVVLIIGDHNVRGSLAAARGDSASPGVYDLLELARARLHNKKTLAGWAPLLVTSEGALVYAPESSICLYTATYESKAVK
jgi:phage gp37-like protein